MMPVMSEPRSINDCYAKVSVRRHHARNPPESGEEIEVLVRIPEQVAKTLAGSAPKPSISILNVRSQVKSVANETALMGTTAPTTVTLGLVIDATIPPTFPVEATFTDQDGVEGWILPKLD
jgi:hypothetical protein